MKVDFHTHIWNDQQDRVAEFVTTASGLGVDKSVVLPIAPYMSNEDVARLVATDPDHLIGFASVVPFAQTTSIPREDPVETLGHAVEKLGLRGLKLHPLIQGFDLADPGLVPVVSAAGDLGIPVIFHTGPSNGRTGRLANGHAEKLDDLAIMCPNTILVAGHADPNSEAFYIARKHPNVYLETSIAWALWGSIIPNLTRRIVRETGPEKVLYGTDFSLGRQQRVIDTDAVFNSSGLSEDELALVFGGNALRILGDQR
jgi:predicted TIM-barrel fold metal-dependent hydrolase